MARATRKCSTCGIAGHTAKKCPQNEEQRRWEAEQAAMPEPTHLHYGDNHSTKLYLCGAERVGWPERCMDDAFARQLPICETCTQHHEERVAAHAAAASRGDKS